ncbi:MAG TPA: TetR/AcrR family transcriptional regulator [Acidimicrobiales bacterium]|nr:TetR/AcrR family transcriptional regulator [Acidimicrobiales bacterium]
MSTIEAPPTGKGVRTRAAVLAAAVDQFAAVGSRSASVPAIARAVGLSTSAVYAYFASKDDLFAAAVDADAAGLIADALPEVVGGRFDGDFEGALTRLFAALGEHPLARRVLEGAEAGAMERLTVLPAESRLQVGIAAALREGQRLGTVRADIDPVVHAAGLLAVVVAMLVSLVQTHGQVDSQYAKGAIAVLEAAIRPS